MNALQQLAEREFPYTDVGHEQLDWATRKYTDEMRLAFIRGAELAEEFMLWIDNKSPQLATAWSATFQLFLTSKLKGDDIK